MLITRKGLVRIQNATVLMFLYMKNCPPHQTRDGQFFLAVKTPSLMTLPIWSCLFWRSRGELNPCEASRFAIASQLDPLRSKNAARFADRGSWLPTRMGRAWEGMGVPSQSFGSSAAQSRRPPKKTAPSGADN